MGSSSCLWVLNLSPSVRFLHPHWTVLLTAYSEYFKPPALHEGSKLTAYWVLVVNLSLVKLLEEVCVCLHIPKYFRRVMVCVLRIRGPLCSQQMMLGKPQPLLQGSLTGLSIASMAPTGFALFPPSLSFAKRT